MNTLFAAVVPVALIIFVGLIAGKRFDWDKKPLAQLSIYVLAPALVADSLYRNTLSVRSTVGLLVGFVLVSLVLFGISWLIQRLLRLNSSAAKSLMATALLPNNGNMGLPVVTFALGNEGLERAIIVMIGSSIL
ncbi:MAG: AEC family transporter, partial [Microcystaceae cyanobacterium]